MRTTLGQLLVNEALPEELRDYQRPLDKKGTQALLRVVAEKYPEQYKDITKRLADIGKDVAYSEGSSISLKDLQPAYAKQLVIPALREKIRAITNDKTLTQEQKEQQIIQETSKLVGKLDDAILLEGIKDKNRLTTYISSGARGGKSQLGQMRGASLLVSDHRGNVIPIPILSSFSEGLDPVEMWASSYGVRSGYVDIKQATPKAGFFGKQLANAAHRLIVSREKPLPGSGLPVETDDPDNEGAVLAHDYGQFKVGTILTPNILKQLKRKHPKIVVYSPMAAPAAGGGVPQWAVGVRENGMAAPGDNVGIAAAQAISEPLAQSSISSKHVGGVVGAAGGGSSAETNKGFEAVNRLANIPKHFEGRSPVAELDGSVSHVEDAPQGGKYVYIGNTQHYVGVGQDLAVRPGQVVEAGDVLSTSLPNPADVVRHKGIGEGRRYFMQSLRNVLDASGVRAHRRNLELLSRALINHVRITGDNSPAGSLPDDIVEYDDFAARYVPREGAKAMKTKLARGKYLEQPVLHYSIGTRMTPRVMVELQEHGVSDVMVHDNQPDFEPEMQRAMDSLSHDKDWMTRMGGFHLQKNLLKSVHRGATSELTGSTSYMPGTARGIALGTGDTSPY